ncbi:aminotransferase class V-fold PLP-dependent enzyme [Olivibacter sp. CPCC 100613]|uniref:aminotransferase class V-fold PLP-dependent enzyme n=1 Tax=Olivibacter sp. CPCC 100613 TaxID=3079931 RepID=UPI002FF9CE75
MRRRELLKYLSMLPAGGLITPYVDVNQLLWTGKQRAGRELFKELGVRTFINAAGTYTAMTGSLMRPEVLEAINYSAQDFCMLDELQDKVGEKIAELVHAESAVVTAGCFSAMTLGLAGILTGIDEEKATQLPHLQGTNMKSEVICQKGHEIVYTHALKNTGCNIVMVETREELEQAINERTALMFFLNVQADRGQIMHKEWVAIAKKHGVPTMIDIAADVPPVSNLWKFHEMGFDLVCVSGGKAIRGPQSAGLLMGKKNFVQAARLHMPPRGFNIGRGMKVNKEEVLGMYVALEKFVHLDHQREWELQKQQVDLIAMAAKTVDGVTTEIKTPPLGNVTPTLHIHWNPEKVKISGKELQQRLRAGNPSIEIGGAEDKSLVLTAWMLKPGQEKVVAKRLREELSTVV